MMILQIVMTRQLTAKQLLQRLRVQRLQMQRLQMQQLRVRRLTRLLPRPMLHLTSISSYSIVALGTRTIRNDLLV